jgi:hypothetical protein
VKPEVTPVEETKAKKVKPGAKKVKPEVTPVEVPENHLQSLLALFWILALLDM